MPEKPRMTPPVANANQNSGQCEHLPNLDTSIETHDVGDETIPRHRELLKLRRKSKPVKQAKRHDCDASVWSESEQPIESADVLECLVDNRQPNDRVDDVRVRVNAAEHADKQCEAVANREETHVQDNILQPVEKKDHADEEHQVVVPGDHVLRAEIHEWTNGRAVDRLDEQRVAT